MRSSIFRNLNCVAICILLCASSSSLAAPPGSRTALAQDSARANIRKAAQSGPRKLLLAVRVNGVETAAATPVLREGERYYVLRSALQSWRFKLADSGAMLDQGENFQALDALPDVSYRIDTEAQALLIDAPSSSFVHTLLSGGDSSPRPQTTTQSGWLLNYDLQFEKAGEFKAYNGARAEAGFFNSHGVGFFSFWTHNYDEGVQRLYRLDTTWRQDDPATKHTLRLGDSISDSSGWGRALRFGGMQWGTNNALQPYVTPFQLPELSGQATAASTVDIYVNGALRAQRNVPYGPFQINDIPVSVGAGEVRAVIRDQDGREHVVTKSYYVSPSLLRAGTQEYQIDAGWLRRAYATQDDRYENLAGVASHRYGVNERMTTNLRAEASGDVQALGAGATVALPASLVADGSLALSRATEGSGYLATAGVEHSGREFRFSLAAQYASTEFRRLSAEADDVPDRWRAFANIGTSFFKRDNASASYTVSDHPHYGRQEFVSLIYQFPQYKSFSLSMYYSDALTQESAYSYGLMLSLNMDGFGASKRRHHASLQWNKAAGRDGLFSAQWQSDPPTGPGYGYRLSSTQLDEGVLNEGALSINTDSNALLLGLSQHQGNVGYQFGASGAVASVGGNSFFSREINDGFAVVKVGDHPNIRIYRDNAVVARTNDEGVALITGLRAYEANNLRFEHEDLPLNVTVRDTELDVAPRFRSGLMVEFPVQTNRYTWLKLIDAQGAPLPAGTTVRIDDEVHSHYVALRGEAYIANLASGAHRLEVNHRGAHCRAQIDVPASKDSLVRLGTVSCIGVH